ncbi:cation:proton antiporter regulatory subunit [Nocardioides pelophilus]|uniref:cation:proton antiporter regulatory subunit n=1 Tax=Nocardioides pelophilus TaxID=2172019 RepID=UPI001604647A|nr:TrkA C-terminal domain-containing protein [Nocardioides pelophilus]
MHDDELDFRIKEIHVGAGSPVDGVTIEELDLRTRTGALLLAVRRPGQSFEPNPPGDLVVPSGSVLIVLGTQAELDATTRLGSS